VPELPEVEVTRQRIGPLLIGRRIRSVVTTRPSYLFLTRPAVLRRALVGRAVRVLERRGKYLVARLDDGARLVIHLGMTGQLFSGHATSPRLLSAARRSALRQAERAARQGRAELIEPQQRGFRPDAHTHLRLGFDDRGPDVFLRDVRKFGKVLLLGSGESHERLDRLGVDALELSGEALLAASRGRRVAIKALLLDQAVATGIGNIYADEALFRARLRPTRRAGKLSGRECADLADAVRAVLQRSIETGGSSIRDYVAPDGADGAFQDERRVYGRGGAECHACGARIRRVLVAQRSTHYCPTCQR
jgi:formamidopyrimidine-DNA glycosylase